MMELGRTGVFFTKESSYTIKNFTPSRRNFVSMATEANDTAMRFELLPRSMSIGKKVKALKILQCKECV